MTDKQTLTPTGAIAEDEINLLSLIRTMWNGRKIIILSVMIGAILGIFIAFLSPKVFTASTVMVPQLGGDADSKLGGLGGLAALAGISLDLSKDADLSPMIYPQVVGSIPFQLELMNDSLHFSEFAKPVSLFDYYTIYHQPSVFKKYTIGLPGMIIKAIKGKPKELILPNDSTFKPILLTYNQYEVKKKLDDLISLEVNSKEGYLTLTAELPEALAAAQLTQKAQDLLQRYITDFKIEKAKSYLHFIEQRYNETKAEFEKAQISLAMINDRNKDFTSGLSRIETDRIQTRYTIAFGVYQELAKQFEQAKIQVKKETPVFTIVEPVTIPSEKSKPKRAIILMIWIFFGGIAGICILLAKEFLSGINPKLHND